MSTEEVVKTNELGVIEPYNYPLDVKIVQKIDEEAFAWIDLPAYKRKWWSTVRGYIFKQSLQSPIVGYMVYSYLETQNDRIFIELVKGYW